MNVLITGASKGIGRELCLQFANKQKCNIIAISRDNEKLLELSNEINSKSISKLIPISFDLKNSNISQITNAVAELGNLNILINNAAILINKKFINITDEEIIEILNINFVASARLIRELHKYMGNESKSHIINISSMGGFQGSMKFSGMSIYNASKAALSCLSEILAVEFEKDNISVNCLAIGAVQTEMLTSAFPNFKAPLKSEEMAEYIVDFAMNGNKYFNGKVLPVAVSIP